MADPAESRAHSNTVGAAHAQLRMQQMQAQAGAGGPGAAGAGHAGAPPPPGPNGGAGGQVDGGEGQQQHLLQLLPHSSTQKGRANHLRTIESNLHHVVPDIWQHTPAGRHGRLRVEELDAIFGEAPEYPEGPLFPAPWDYLGTLLQWSLQPGVSLADCIVQLGSKRYLDLERLHAAGCFPHTWTFPLSLDGVQAANRQAQAVYNQGPEGRERLLQEARAVLVYEVARQVAKAQPPAWEQLQHNLRQVLELEGVALPPNPGGGPAALAPAAAPAEPSPLLQRVQQTLVAALGFDPNAAGPANAEDPRTRPFGYLACYLAQATSPAKDIVERWGEYPEARRQWLLDELVLVATEGAWVQAGPRLQAVLALPEAVL